MYCYYIPPVGGELFGLALGGYGMFGVMVDIELKIAENVHLFLETINCEAESANMSIFHIKIVPTNCEAESAKNGTCDV